MLIALRIVTEVASLAAFVAMIGIWSVIAGA